MPLPNKAWRICSSACNFFLIPFISFTLEFLPFPSLHVYAISPLITMNPEKPGETFSKEKGATPRRTYIHWRLKLIMYLMSDSSQIQINPLKYISLTYKIIPFVNDVGFLVFPCRWF